MGSRYSRFLGPVVLGGAMLLGTDGVPQSSDSQPQPSHEVDVLRSSSNAALIRILTGKDRATSFGGRTADNRKHRAADIMMERLQQATWKELIDCLDVPFFAIRQRATELLLKQGLSNIEVTKAPVDTSYFRQEHEGQSSEQRQRLQWIADILDYAGMQSVWDGSVFQPSGEEMRAVTSVGDMLRLLSSGTRNPIDIIQYSVCNERALSSLFRDVEHLRGRTFWEVFRDIHDERGCYVSPISIVHGRLYAEAVFSRPISSSDGALYGYIERRDYSPCMYYVRVALEPKLDLVRCMVRDVTMRRPDGRIADISWTIEEGVEKGEFILYLPYLPAAEHKDESVVDIDIRCDVEALPMNIFVVDDPGTPASVQVETITARYTGVSYRPDKHGMCIVSLSLECHGTYPDLNHLWWRIGCTAFDEKGERISSGGSQWFGENAPRVEWIFYGKPARMEFAVPDPTLLQASKTLHFTGVKLPEQAQVR